MTLIPRKVWIAGASGFSGRALTLALHQHPHYLPLPHLRPNSSRLEQLKHIWLEAGLTPQILAWDQIEDHLHQLQPDVIISCIGTTKQQARQGGGNYREVDYALNVQLIEIATKLAIPPHFIYISSMGAQWGKWNAYLQVRLEIERLLCQTHLNYSIIRPALLAGMSRTERRNLEKTGEWLCLWLAHGLTRIGLQKFADQFKPLDAPEVASFIMHILEQSHENSHHQNGVYLVDMIHQTLRTHQLTSPQKINLLSKY